MEALAIYENAGRIFAAQAAQMNNRWNTEHVEKLLDWSLEMAIKLAHKMETST